MNTLFEELKMGLEDAIAHSKGKLHLRSEYIEIPEPSSDFKSQQMSNIIKRN